MGKGGLDHRAFDVRERPPDQTFQSQGGAVGGMRRKECDMKACWGSRKSPEAG